MNPISFGLLLFIFLSYQEVHCAPCPSELGVCLRPLIDTWEHIRNVEDHAANLIFPLPLYRRNSTLVLCEQYDTVRRKCLSGENCGSNPMANFVSQQLGYICGEFLPLYMNQHECSSTTLLRNRHCLRHLHGMPNPFISNVRCQNFSDFFDCAEPFLEKKCSHESTLFLGGAIMAFGCELQKGGKISKGLKAINSSEEYTNEKLLAFFNENRPANFSSLVTSAEVVTSSEGGKTPKIEDSSTITSTTLGETTSTTVVLTTEERMTTSERSEEDVDMPKEAAKTGEISEETKEVMWTTETFKEQGSTSTEGTTKESESFSQGEAKTSPELTTIEEKELATTMTALFTNSEIAVGENVSLAEEKNKTLEDNGTNSTLLLLTTETIEVKREDAEQTSAKCSQEDEDYIKACHEHLLRRLSKLAPQESSMQVRFPLFGVPLPEVLTLCKMFDEGNKCAMEQLPRCEQMQMVRLIGTQLEALCFRIDSMKRDYQCMQDTYDENPRCLKPITGVLDGDLDPCTGQQDSFDCFSSALECIPGARILAREMIRGQGCRVDVKRWLTKKPTTTTRRTTPAPTTPSNSTDGELDDGALLPLLSSTSSPIAETTDEVATTTVTTTTEEVTTTKEPLAFTETNVEPLTPPWFFSTCHPVSRRTARMCMGPLLRTWDNLRKTKLQVRKSQFPVYKYTKTELLELCDGYANAFLCAGHETIRRCLQDELVSFAQGHLGYQCSPQNLARFMAHYDCIIAVEENSECRQLVVGEALPTSKTDRVCVDVTAYAECMTPLIGNSCKPEAVTEFKRTIQQFGCKKINES